MQCIWLMYSRASLRFYIVVVVVLNNTDLATRVVPAQVNNTGILSGKLYGEIGGFLGF